MSVEAFRHHEQHGRWPGDSEAVIGHNVAPVADSVEAITERIEDLAREAGPDVQANPFGAFALTMATGLVNGTVDAMVTPMGLAGVMQGRALWKNTLDGFRRPATDAGGQPLPPPEPWRDAKYRYESPSRFTITTRDESGKPLVFVLRRDGLRWRLADIRLPLGQPGP